MSPRDSGLQPERTALAWTRTAISLLVNAVIVTRIGVVERDAWLALSGGVVGGLSVLVVALAMVRRRQLEAEAGSVVSSRVVLCASGCVVISAMCGGWAIVGGLNVT